MAGLGVCPNGAPPPPPTLAAIIPFLHHRRERNPVTKEAFPLKGSSRRRLPFLCGGQKIPSRKLIKLFPSSSFFVTSSRKVGFAMPIKRGEGGDRERERKRPCWISWNKNFSPPSLFLSSQFRALAPITRKKRDCSVWSKVGSPFGPNATRGFPEKENPRKRSLRRHGTMSYSLLFRGKKRERNVLLQAFWEMKFRDKRERDMS